jgi:electron transport complex protein RnfG
MRKSSLFSPPIDALWYQGASLGLVALSASAALAFAHQATGPAIAEAAARDTATSLSQVLPPDFADNDLLKDTISLPMAGAQPLTVYQARRTEEVHGVVFAVTAKGYAGPIRIMMGVDRSGRLLGVRVTRHTETPGLGDKIEFAKNPWVDSFSGKSLESPPPARWAVKKDGGDFDQFAGATITPRAVVNAVRSGLELFANNRSAMLADDHHLQPRKKEPTS